MKNYIKLTNKMINVKHIAGMSIRPDAYYINIEGDCDRKIIIKKYENPIDYQTITNWIKKDENFIDYQTITNLINEV